MIRAKVERMFNSGKSVNLIADYFGLPINIIETMITEPPLKLRGGFPDQNDRTRSLYYFNRKYGMLKERGAKIPKFDRDEQMRIDKIKTERDRLTSLKATMGGIRRGG